MLRFNVSFLIPWRRNLILKRGRIGIRYNNSIEFCELKVHPKEVISRGGKKLMKEYNNSIINALTSIYPEYSWKRWLFKPLPIGFFRDVKNQVYSNFY